MQKTLRTFEEHVNSCNDATILLRHIAKMMALQQIEYTDKYVMDELRGALTMEMVKYDTEHCGQNYEVTCTYCGVTESSTFRARKLGTSMFDLARDEMSLDDYVQKVVDPISKELVARIARKVEGFLSETECEIDVGLCPLEPARQDC